MFIVIVIETWVKRDGNGDIIEETLWDRLTAHDGYPKAMEYYRTLFDENGHMRENTDGFGVYSANICLPVRSTEAHYVGRWGSQDGNTYSKELGDWCDESLIRRVTNAVRRDDSVSNVITTYDPNRKYTVQYDPYAGRGDFVVYEWSVYEPTSVLAGQERKAYKKDFPTIEEALKEYPTAVQDDRRPYNYTDHLPDEEMTAYQDENYGYPEDY